MSWRACLLLMLWIGFLTPPTYGELLTPAELDSLIESGRFYTADEVKTLVWQIIQAADEEIRQTAAQAVKMAIIPLAGELAGERVRAERWQAEYRQELALRIRAERWGRVGLVAGIAAAVFSGGVALGAAAF